MGVHSNGVRHGMFSYRDITAESALDWCFKRLDSWCGVGIVSNSVIA